MSSTTDGVWPDDVFSRHEQRELLRAAEAIVSESSEPVVVVTYHEDYDDFLHDFKTLVQWMLANEEAALSLSGVLREWVDSAWMSYCQSDGVPPDTELNELISEYVMTFEYDEDDE